MKTIHFIKKEIPLWIIILVPLIILAFNWKNLPDQMPIHWNVHGEIDNYGSKFMFPAMLIGIYILLLVLPKIDPKKYNYKYFEQVYYTLRIVIVSFFSMVQTIITLNMLGAQIKMEKIIVSSLFILFLILGNYMGKIKANWFIGIRTPWTLSNENVWRKTHLLASKIWFWGSLLGFVMSFILKEKALFVMILILVGIFTIIPITYSFFIFKTESNKTNS